MTSWNLPWPGGCLCGQVRFRITEPPLLSMACHCTGCQKLSASAYSLSLAVPASALIIEQGDLEIGALHGPHRHTFCVHCKNWMFTYPHGMDFFINIRATMLDDHAWYEPFVEVYTDEMLPWAKTGAAHSFAQQPDMDGYQPLIEAYAQLGARPR